MKDFKEVTQEEFFENINQMDALIFREGKWPYTNVWVNRNGEIVGKSIPYGKHIGVSNDNYKYYLTVK